MALYIGEIWERFTRGKRWTRAQFESPMFSVESTTCDHNPHTEPYDDSCPCCRLFWETANDPEWVKPGTEPRPWVDSDEPEEWLLEDDEEDD